MTTTHVWPLRLVTGATPDRVLRAASSRRASGPAASVSRVASVTGPTPGSERRIVASPGPLSWAALLSSGARTGGPMPPPYAPYGGRYLYVGPGVIRGRTLST